MSTIQNLRKSLVRDWKPVCSFVGDAISGAEFVPFPSLLSPASGGGWARTQLASSSLVLTQSVFLGTGRGGGVSYFGAFPRLILSLFLPHSLSFYLSLAHSDCLQGFQVLSLPYAMPPPAPLCSARTCWWWMGASGVFFCWELFLGM